MAINLTVPESEQLRRLGLALKQARLAAKQSHEELAARIGVSRYTVAAMEKGGPGVSMAAWIKASSLLGRLDSWENVLAEEENPFAEFDRNKGAAVQLERARVRKI